MGPSQTRSEPSPLRVDALRNRIRILVAAESLFAARGLDVSIEQIARLAGVSVGTVYRHFAAKEALIEAVFSGRLRRLADHAGALAEKSDPGRAFFDFVSGMVGENPTERVFSDAMSRAGLDVEAAATRPDDPLHVALARLLERAQRSGEVHPDVSVPDLVTSMVGVVHAMRHAGGATRVRTRALTIVVDGLRPPAVRQRRRRKGPSARRR